MRLGYGGHSGGVTPVPISNTEVKSPSDPGCTEVRKPSGSPGRRQPVPWWCSSAYHSGLSLPRLGFKSRPGRHSQLFCWARSSVWKSARLLTWWSGVRIPAGPLKGRGGKEWLRRVVEGRVRKYRKLR